MRFNPPQDSAPNHLPPHAAAPAATRRRTSRILRGGAGLLAVVVLLAIGRQRASTVLAVVGLAGLGIGSYGIRKRRVGWARINSRARAAVVVGAAILALLVSAGVAPASPPTQPAADSTPGPATSAGLASTATTATTPPSQTPSSSTATAPTATATTATPTAVSSDQAAIEQASRGTALALLAGITVGGRSAKTGYARAAFGQAWSDTDRNGCDTRNDVLRRDLTSYVLKAGTRGCLVLSGTLRDPYTGRTIRFVRGPTSSMAVQVDHVVALSDAWQKGAQQWTAAKREAFANDPLNLLAVDGPTNARKGDGDAATWLPPVTAYRCSYVARQVAVKARYGLRMTSAERTASARILSSCPTQKPPRASAFTLGGGTVRAEPAAKPKPKPSATTRSTPTDPRFGTCKEAIAHGYGPYYRGQDAEYPWYIDRDSDGIVCER